MDVCVCDFNLVLRVSVYIGKSKNISEVHLGREKNKYKID